MNQPTTAKRLEAVKSRHFCDPIKWQLSKAPHSVAASTWSSYEKLTQGMNDCMAILSMLPV